MTEIFVLGGHQSDFARNWAREGAGLNGMLRESTLHALADAAIAPQDVQAVHVGNFCGELFAGQGLLASYLLEAVPEMGAIPGARHEAACASGSMALMAAIHAIKAGECDVALVAGVELMRNVSGEQAARYLGTAAWAGHEAQEARYLWPRMFSNLYEDYDVRYGMHYAHIAAIAENNFACARQNPLAQTRGWQFAEGAFRPDDALNPVVEGHMRRNDCGQVTDGVAVVVLASDTYVKARLAARVASLPRVLGWAQGGARLSYAGKLSDAKAQQAKPEGYLFPHLADCFGRALSRAGLASPWDLDAAEVHDCFSMTEYMLLEHMGLCAPGHAWQLVEAGDCFKGGKLPVNPSGGLIGGGHPVGATGVRMLLDAARQVSGRAGGCQVEGAKRVATLNVGGSTSAVASFVVGAA